MRSETREEFRGPGFRVAKLVKSFGMWRFAESLDGFRYGPTRKLSCVRLLGVGGVRRIRYDLFQRFGEFRD